MLQRYADKGKGKGKDKEPVAPDASLLPEGELRHTMVLPVNTAARDWLARGVPLRLWKVESLATMDALTDAQKAELAAPAKGKKGVTHLRCLLKCRCIWVCALTPPFVVHPERAGGTPPSTPHWQCSCATSPHWQCACAGDAGVSVTWSWRERRTQLGEALVPLLPIVCGQQQISLPALFAAPKPLCDDHGHLIPAAVNTATRKHATAECSLHVELLPAAAAGEAACEQ